MSEKLRSASAEAGRSSEVRGETERLLGAGVEPILDSLTATEAMLLEGVIEALDPSNPNYEQNKIVAAQYALADILLARKYAEGERV